MAIFTQFLHEEKPEYILHRRLGYIRRWLEFIPAFNGTVIYNRGYIIKVVFITHERYWFLLPRLSATFYLPRPTCVRIINWFKLERFFSIWVSQRSDNGQFTLVEEIPPGTNDAGGPAIVVICIRDLMAYSIHIVYIYTHVYIYTYIYIRILD